QAEDGIRDFHVTGVQTCALPISPSARADVTAAQVETSIRRGVEYLRKKQLATGGWDEFQGYSCGLSALCTLALANAGVAPEDPKIGRASCRERVQMPAGSVRMKT